MLLPLLRMQQRTEMLYLLERVENMQIFAHENLVFFAFPSIKYANATQRTAGSLRSHTQHVMHTHTHTHGMAVQPAVARPSAHHRQGCVGRRSLCPDSLAAMLFHLFPAVVFKLSWQRGQGDVCQHPACCHPPGCHPRPPPAAQVSKNTWCGGPNACRMWQESL